VGDRVVHQVFGEGLVVDVRARDFFDILEIAFSDGVRKVTSIHPQLVKAPGDDGDPSPRQESSAVQSTGGLLIDEPDDIERARPRSTAHKRTVQPTTALVDPSTYRFARSRILEIDADSLKPFQNGKGLEVVPPTAFFFHLDALRIARQRGFARLLALNHARDVQRLEHQIRACLRVLREMKGRALLADEVGLGKTVEGCSANGARSCSTSSTSRSRCSAAASGGMRTPSCWRRWIRPNPRATDRRFVSGASTSWSSTKRIVCATT
jgi:hypothetical protein